MRAIAILLLGASLALAQQTTAITIPGGVIYQAGAQFGLDYISPTAATAIIQQKVGLNWKTIGVRVLTDGSIGVLSAGLGGVVSISKPILTGLAVGHGFIDTEVEPILATAAPSGLANLAPVVQMTGSLVVTSGSCAEATIFASQFPAPGASVSARAMLRRASKPTTALPSPVTLTIMGASVTFTPQTVTVLKNAAGTNIKQFIPVDVLACPQQSSSPVAPLIGAIRPFVIPRVDIPKLPMPIDAPAFRQELAEMAPLPVVAAPLVEPAVEYNMEILVKILQARIAGMHALDPKPAASNVYLQVAAVSPKASDALLSKLKSMGFDGVEKPVPNSSAMRVMVGPFAKDAVPQMRASLDSKGFVGSGAIARSIQ